MENGLSEVRIYRAIGEKLRVDPSAVQRPVKLFEGTGTVSSIQGCHEPLNKQLSAHDEMVILELVLEHPSMYLQWVRVLSHNRQVLMSVQLQYADFYKNRNSHTRNCLFELNNDMMSSVQISYISFKPHMLIFIDETGTDKRTALHKYGHSFKGTRAVTDRLLGGGEGGDSSQL